MKAAVDAERDLSSVLQPIESYQQNHTLILMLYRLEGGL